MIPSIPGFVTCLLHVNTIKQCSFTRGLLVGLKASARNTAEQRAYLQFVFCSLLFIEHVGFFFINNVLFILTLVWLVSL